MAFSDLIFIDENGLTYPDFPEVLTYVQDEYKTIYGSDVNLDADSQDGQWLAIISLAIFNAVEESAAVYNSFSPYTAQSDALTRNVKINGIQRGAPSQSQVDLTIIGTGGTVINNGIAEDILSQKWNLPSSVVIPLSGTVVVTAFAQQFGALEAEIGTVNKIATPTLGWQTVNNLFAAQAGQDEESDASLRRQQSKSTELPSVTILEGIEGDVFALTGVTNVKAYQNDENFIDSDGIPANSISLVVQGGASQDIGDAIALSKPPGSGTFGTTSVITTDSRGVTNTINFFRPTVAIISVEITLDVSVGYSADTGDAIKQATADYINTLDIGDDVFVSKLYVPANLGNLGEEISQTFDVTQILVDRDGGGLQPNNILIAFNEIATCDPNDVTVITV